MSSYQGARRHGSVLLVLAVATALSAFLVGSPAMAGQPVDSSATSISTAVAYAIQFRAEYGFRDDVGFVVMAEADATLSHEYGVALTADEVADMHRRDALQEGLGPLTDSLQKDPTFAGLYLDQAAGGVLDIATTGDPAAIGPVVDALAPAGAVTRVRHVSYSLAELADLQTTITLAQPTWLKAGITMASVGVDVQANRVRVVVDGLTEGAAAALTAAYGDRTEIVAGELAQPSACNSRTDCGSPLKGGLSITGDGWVCTSGV